MSRDGSIAALSPSGGLRGRVLAWLGGSIPFQAGVYAVLFLLAALAYHNVSANMARTGLTPGFSYLGQPAGFDIAEQLIAYQPGDTYARALLVGLLNTVKVSILGCLLATVLGVTLGIVRLSGNVVLSRLVQAYVELIRNTPLPLQLFFWIATFRALPPAREAFEPLPSLFLSVRGVAVPWFAVEQGALWPSIAVIAVVIAVAAIIACRRDRGLSPSIWAAVAAGAVLLALGAAKATGLELRPDVPKLSGFNILGGLDLTPEFAALLVGLTVNSAAGIAEIVRSGIQSVSSGQWEAGTALGLPRRRIMRLVVLPQAMRVITPLLTSSYLDLTKNSSLGVLIGYTEFVAVVNTAANNTGQAIETIVVLVAVFLALNLSVSYLMNRYNRRLERRGMLAR